MRVLRREFNNVKRSDVFRVYPIGDAHVGAAACDEDRLRRWVKMIAEDQQGYWIGIGDYLDAINRNDKRFSVGTLAKWLIDMDALGDIVKAQKLRFLDIIKPIASKCLVLVEGNHETAITKYCERYVFGEIEDEIKRIGGFPDTHRLGVGYNGWLQLAFKRNDEQVRSLITMFLHHGFTGGQLAGAKALGMQRWLWTHEADITLFGHSHNTSVQVEAVERIDREGHLQTDHRIGAFCGTFLRSTNEQGPSTYAEVKGYLPMPTSNIVIELRPGAHDPRRRIKVIPVS